MARSSARDHIPAGELSKNITLTQTPKGYRARGRYRGLDGALGQVEGTGPTAEAAIARMESRARERIWPGQRPLSASSSTGELIDAWLGECEENSALKPQSVAQYRSCAEKHIRPAIGGVAIGALTVPILDSVVQAHVRAGHPATAARVRKYLTMMLAIAVRKGVLTHNIARDVITVAREPRKPMAIEPDTVRLIRKALREFRTGDDGPSFYGPRADGQLPQFIEVMLGCSARPGEVLALRWCDVDLTSETPTVHIRATMVGSVRQETPKHVSQERVIAIPRYTVRALLERKQVAEHVGAEDFIFTTRTGRPHTVGNMGKRWDRFRRNAEGLPDVDLEGLKLYAFRKTVATTLARNVDLELARDVLGHSTIKTTEEFYEARTKFVNPLSAAVLDSVLGDIEQDWARFADELGVPETRPASRSSGTGF